MQTFEANLELTTFWVMLGVAVLFLGGMIALVQRRPAAGDHNRQMLLSMLLFFGMLIAGATAALDYWNASRIATVRLLPERLETGYGTVRYDQVKQFFIKSEQNYALFGVKKGSPVKLLVIEEKTGKTHVLSEVNYDVLAIARALDERIN